MGHREDCLFSVLIAFVCASRSFCLSFLITGSIFSYPSGTFSLLVLGMLNTVVSCIRKLCFDIDGACYMQDIITVTAILRIVKNNCCSVRNFCSIVVIDSGI